jgi:hypothetical protein
MSLTLRTQVCVHGNRPCNRCRLTAADRHVADRRERVCRTSASDGTGFYDSVITLLYNRLLGAVLGLSSQLSSWGPVTRPNHPCCRARQFVLVSSMMPLLRVRATSAIFVCDHTMSSATGAACFGASCLRAVHRRYLAQRLPYPPQDALQSSAQAVRRSILSQF